MPERTDEQEQTLLLLDGGPIWDAPITLARAQAELEDAGQQLASERVGRLIAAVADRRLSGGQALDQLDTLMAALPPLPPVRLTGSTERTA